MAKKAKRSRQRPEPVRKFKKKTSPLVIGGVEYVDYKDVDLLTRFMSDRSKIRNMRVSGNDRQQQLEVAKAIKIAREMALIPYTTRVASQPRGGRNRDERRGRDMNDQTDDAQRDDADVDDLETTEVDGGGLEAADGDDEGEG